MKNNLYKNIAIASAMVLFINETNAQFIGSGGATILQNTPDFVGVGITSPAFKLDVDGDINMSLGKSLFVDGNQAFHLDPSVINLKIGLNSGYGNTIPNNVIVGSHSGNLITAGGNVIVGNNAGTSKIGGRNVFVGNEAGSGVNDGSGNTAVGHHAGFVIVHGNDNSYFGSNAGGPLTFPGISNSTAIGANAFVGASNSLILGENVNVGIGVHVPNYKFHVEGGNGFFKEKLFVGDAPYFSSNFAYRGRHIVLEDISGQSGSTQTCAGAFNNYGDKDDVIGVGAWSIGKARKHYGIQGAAFGSCAEGQSVYGVYGIPYNGYYNYGVYGEVNAESSSRCQNGIYHAVHGEASNVGNANFWAGYFNGDFYYSGSWKSSDAKLKTNVNDLTTALESIKKLKPRTYEYKTDDESLKGLYMPQGLNIGFIAQELEEVFPTLVKNTINPAVVDKQGKLKHPEVEFKAVDYISLIPVLTAGIQEQQKLIEQQNTKLAVLESELAAIKATNSNNATGKGTPVLTSKSSLAADPNPFQKATKISYDLTGNSFVSADLKIQDRNGLDIKRISITDAKGSITISSSDLTTTGVYYVYLIVDNNISDVIKVIYLN